MEVMRTRYGIQEVDGSIPFSSTNLFNRLASRARETGFGQFKKEFKGAGQNLIPTHPETSSHPDFAV
jgi:hypothetical protein